MGARPGVADFEVVGEGAGVVAHVAEVVFARGGVGVAGGEVVFWEFEDDGEEGEDFAC